jgi:hypothetical protein
MNQQPEKEPQQQRQGANDPATSRDWDRDKKSENQQQQNPKRDQQGGRESN